MNDPNRRSSWSGRWEKWSHAYCDGMVRNVKRSWKWFLVLLLLEPIALCCSSDLKVLGLNATTLRIADLFHAEDHLVPYAAGWYAIGGFLDDMKKLIIYIPNLAWVLIARKYVDVLYGPSGSPRPYRKLALVHFCIAAGASVVYARWIAMSEHEHLFGERGIGLFSSLGWLAVPDSPVSATTAIALFIYRLSAVLHAFLILFLSTFPIVLLVWRLTERRSSEAAPAQAEAVEAPPENAEPAKRPAEQMLKALFAIGVVIMTTYISLRSTAGRVGASQLLFALAICFFLGLPLAYYLYRTLIKDWSRANEMKQWFTGGLALVLFTLYPKVRDEAVSLFYEAWHGDPDRRQVADIKALGTACNLMGNSTGSSARVFDATRLLWEQFPNERVNDGPSQATAVVYLVASARLQHLERWCAVPGNSAVNDPTSDPTQRLLAAFQPGHSFRWRVGPSTSRHCGWRWRTQLFNEVRKAQEHDPFVERLLADTALKSPFLQLLAHDLLPYAAGGRMDTTGAATDPRIRRVADYLRLVDEDPIWRYDQGRLCQCTP